MCAYRKYHSYFGEFCFSDGDPILERTGTEKKESDLKIKNPYMGLGTALCCENITVASKLKK
jgi:hypothetical protein